MVLDGAAEAFGLDSFSKRHALNRHAKLTPPHASAPEAGDVDSGLRLDTVDDLFGICATTDKLSASTATESDGGPSESPPTRPAAGSNVGDADLDLEELMTEWHAMPLDASDPDLAVGDMV
jgi:hypothetical protein